MNRIEPGSEGEAEAVLLAHYGIAGRASRLAGEVDLIFRVQAADGREVLLRITAGAEGTSDVRFQTDLLIHLEGADPRLIVPRVIRARGGASEALLADGRSAQLHTFLPGRLLSEADGSAVQRRRLGGWLARLALALRDFRHAAEEREVPWDIARAPALRGMLDALDEGPRRDAAARWLDRFDEVLVPALAGLRRQVVHNDLNRNNVLVDAQDSDIITGIIDFGDAVRTQLVNDVAIAAAYQLAEDGDPLGPVLDFVAGYHAVLSLLPEEIRVLPDLIAMRFVMMATIGAWRARAQPENRAYLMRNHERAWTRLGLIEQLGAAEAARYLMERLEKGPQA